MLHYVKDMVNLEKLIERKIVDAGSSIEDVIESIDHFFDMVDVESTEDIVDHWYTQKAWLDFNNSLILGERIGQKFAGMNTEGRFQFERACRDSLEVWLHLHRKMEESMSKTTISVTDEGLEIETPLFFIPIVNRSTAKTEAVIRYHLFRNSLPKEGPYLVKNKWYSDVGDTENLSELFNNPDSSKLDGQLSIERRKGIFYGKMKVNPSSTVFTEVAEHKRLEPFVFGFGATVDESNYHVSNLCFIMQSYDEPYSLKLLEELGVSVNVNFTFEEEEPSDSTQDTCCNLS